MQHDQYYNPFQNRNAFTNQNADYDGEEDANGEHHEFFGAAGSPIMMAASREYDAPGDEVGTAERMIAEEQLYKHQRER